jgi:predicted MFS family arabinose efflux permease
MEIYVNNPSVANMFTKFSMCISQFLLPYMIGAVASANMSYRTIFIVAGVAIFIDGILILFLPFPERGNKTAAAGQKTKSKLKITPAALAAILIGFTSSSTFMLWLNCNKELGMLYGMTSDQAGKIQSFYAIGTFAAILCSSVLIKKGLKEINILILYPAISTVTLLLCYFIQSPTMCLIGGFAIGFAGAGGVLQLATSTTAEFFPENKATATSMVMIASSIANYTILSLASYITKVGGEGAPRMILLLNAGVTVAGILLAIFVKKNKEA